MDFSKLTKGEQIVLGTGLLLILDLVAFPWHRVSVFGIVAVTRTGVQPPNAIYGILALILAVVMVLQVVLSKLTSAKLPDVPLPWSQVHQIAGAAAFALLLLKLVVETSALGFGAFLGVVLAGGLAFGGYTIAQEGRSGQASSRVPFGQTEKATVASEQAIMMEFVAAPSLDAARIVVSRYPQLRDPAARRLLDTMIATASPGSSAIPELRQARERLEIISSFA